MNTPEDFQPLDMWFFDAMMVDLTHAVYVLDAVSEILCGVPHVREDGSRNVELDRVGAILAAASAHLEKMRAQFDENFTAWRAVAEVSEMNHAAA